MFGAYWCPFCDQERQELGKDVFDKRSSREPSLVRYVECDPRGVGAQPELCRQAGIRSFPTWALSSSSSSSSSSPAAVADAGKPWELFPGSKGLFGLEQILNLPSPPDPSAVPPAIEQSSGQREVAIAKRLKQQGVTMYGTWWCGFCDAQRQTFGREAWAQVPYVECDPRAAGSQPMKCQEAGIQGFPEWVLPSGRHVNGLKDMDAFDDLLATETKSGGGRTSPSTVLPMPGSAADGAACEDCKVGDSLAASGAAAGKR